ncbi:MAG: hypothetical protein ACKOYI_12470, partial [Actinomycetota bacterium]
VNDESLVDTARRDAELLRLSNNLRRAHEALQHAQAERASFELEVLNSRDYAAGQAAIIGELRYRNDRLETSLAASRNEIATVRASTTWKIGRVLMFPVRVAKRILRQG